MLRMFLPLALAALLLTQTLLNGNPPNDHSPAWSPAGDRIAFLRQIDATSTLYRVNTDGSDLAQITSGIQATLPSWSPDSSKIAYIGNGEDVRVMNADGSDDRSLSAGPNLSAPGSRLVWSPDSTRIIYTTVFDLYIIPIDGSAVIHYSDGLALSNPQWSPDGTRISFIRPWESSIILMLAAGHSPGLLINRPRIFDYAWSPDGEKIAFPYSLEDSAESPVEIGVVDVDDGALAMLTNNTTTEAELAWSPDSAHLAYSADDGIYSMKADGSQQQLLAGSQAQGPLWSPDGAYIFFFRQHDSSSDLYRMEANGNNPTLLTSIPVPVPNLALSPDRSEIAYELYRGAYSELYVMDEGGGASTKVSPGLPVRGYSWSPDGKQLAFTLAPAPSAEALYVANADGSAVVKVSRNLLVFSFAWSPDSKRLALMALESATGHLYAFYVADADGNGFAKLDSTTSLEFPSSPVWSLDSRTIAFTRSNIFVANVISDTLTNLTNSTGYYDAPVWSPDGRELAFFGPAGLSRLEIASGEQHDIYASSGANLAWSPRGDKLAFVTMTSCCPSSQVDNDTPNPTSTSVHLINADGSDHTVLGSQSTTPVWSPSGKYLLYNDESPGIVIVEIDTGKTMKTGIHLGGVLPSWAPDESRLVYGNGDLYLLRLGPP